MVKRIKSEQGLTLVEVLVSVGIMLIFIIAAAQTIMNSQFMISYSRHKIQAMYAAQQILEQARMQAFVAANVAAVSAPVTLDNANAFAGTAITTVSNIDANRNHISVEIDWQEQILSAKTTMKEYYSTNIANDPMVN